MKKCPQALKLMQTALSPQLTQPERVALLSLESTIERGLQTFYEVGAALAEIRGLRLYREGYATFEDYCRDRWGIARQTAYQFIGAAEVFENVRNCGQTLPANEAQIRPLAKLEPEQQQVVWAEAAATAPDGKVTAAHVKSVVTEFKISAAHPTGNLASEDEKYYASHEWYTPPEYVDAARQVLGCIDLDPASCEYAQRTVQARSYFTKDDNGLTLPWGGRVWLNPPYEWPVIRHFVSKAILEYESGNVTAAILLTNNCTDSKWFISLAEHYPVMFSRKRVSFYREGCTYFSARQGQALFYLGAEVDKFDDTFAALAYAPA